MLQSHDGPQANAKALDLVPSVSLLVVMMHNLVSLRRVERGTKWASLFVVVVYLARSHAGAWQGIALRPANHGCDNGTMRQIAKRLLSLGIAMIIAAAAGCTKLPPPIPLSELNPQQLRGHEEYQAHCARCHNDRTNQPLNGQSLRGIFKKQYLDSGAPANDDRVMDVIVYGRGMMPAQGNSMTPAERQDLLAYMHTL